MYKRHARLLAILSILFARDLGFCLNQPKIHRHRKVSYPCCFAYFSTGLEAPASCTISRRACGVGIAWRQHRRAQVIWMHRMLSHLQVKRAQYQHHMVVLLRARGGMWQRKRSNLIASNHAQGHHLDGLTRVYCGHMGPIRLSKAAARSSRVSAGAFGV